MGWKTLLTMQKLKLSFVLFLCLGSTSFAQDFLAPYTSFISNKPSYVITQSGDSIGGKLRYAEESNGFIKKVAIEDKTGKVHKFKAENLKRFATKPGTFAKIEAISDNSLSIRQIIKTDFSEIVEREWLIYETQLLPRRKNKSGMLQLLNPGFDQHIKVYNHPFGSKSMPIRLGQVRIVGGEDRTLLVVKDGQKAEIVRKASYRKAFEDLFADAPELANDIKRSPKFKNFAKHIFMYNELKGTYYYTAGE